MKKKTCGSDENELKICCPKQESKLFDLKSVCGYPRYKAPTLVFVPIFGTIGKLKTKEIFLSN